MAAYAISEAEIYDEQRAARYHAPAAASPGYAPALATGRSAVGRRTAHGRRLLFAKGVA